MLISRKGALSGVRLPTGQSTNCRNSCLNSSRAGLALLDIEMDSPSIATVQALVLMSAHEASYTRDARGWLYSGMAMRLAVDLGLHLDVEHYVRARSFSRCEANVRKTTFRGTYCLDR